MICWIYRKGILVKRSIGTEGENAHDHEKPEIMEITGFHDCSHRHFLPPVRLHKAEIGTDDKYLDIGILHS